MKSNEELAAFYDAQVEEEIQKTQLRRILKWALFGLALGAAYVAGTIRCGL